MYFLNQIASYVIANELNHLKDLVIVFPSKRAGLFFKQEFKKIALKKFREPVFIPRTLVIDEFFLSQSKQLLVDDLDAIFLLYKSYKEVYYKDAEHELILLMSFIHLEKWFTKIFRK